MAAALLYPGKMVSFGTLRAYFQKVMELISIRLYTQIDSERAKEIARSHGHTSSIQANGRINDHSLTAEEVLEQTNKIFAPFILRFAAPISWFAVWRSQFLFLPLPTWDQS